MASRLKLSREEILALRAQRETVRRQRREQARLLKLRAKRGMPPDPASPGCHINAVDMGTKVGDFFLYAVTDEQLAYNNSVFMQRLREVRQMTGRNAHIEYDVPAKIDDPQWLLHDLSVQDADTPSMSETD